MATASARFDARSFRSMAFTWVRTVSSPTTSSVAMASFARPVATSRRTSRSRRVNAAKKCVCVCAPPRPFPRHPASSRGETCPSLPRQVGAQCRCSLDGPSTKPGGSRSETANRRRVSGGVCETSGGFDVALGDRFEHRHEGLGIFEEIEVGSEHTGEAVEVEDLLEEQDELRR